jgi:cytochrome c peroxidase
MQRWVWVLPVLILACLIVLPRGFGGRTSPAAARPGPRQPVALILVDHGKVLLAGNRASGTISIVDAQQRKTVGEYTVGHRLSDLAATADGKCIVALDEDEGALVLLALRPNNPPPGMLHPLARIKVGTSPVSVHVNGDGTLASAACLWPRRLAVVDLAAARKNAREPVSYVDLPFAPRRQLPVPGSSKIIVADAFGGLLAVVDLHRRRVESVRNLRVHNIRGLALGRDGKTLIMTHQVLYALGHTTRGDILTGNLITNNVREFSLAAVLDPAADVLRDNRLYQLGDVERGAGDPAAVSPGPDKTLAIALAGVHELAIGRPEEGSWRRVPVGLHPVAMVCDGARAFVANQFSDSISVVDLHAGKSLIEISLGPRADLRPEQRGELLFFDARLSFEGWFSCHSCHTDGHTNGGLNDNFTDGSFGTPKRVLSLRGVKDTGPWAWNGRMPDLESQIRLSLKSTMQGPEPREDQVRDLAAYLRTLPPPPALARARGTDDEKVRQRGRQVFLRNKCQTCHAPPAYTTAKTYDVGLRDEAGLKYFNPPSLRGVSQGGPYFHDNRAQTLEEVFTRFHHEIPADLPARELRDLLAFLRGL